MTNQSNQKIRVQFTPLYRYTVNSITEHLMFEKLICSNCKLCPVQGESDCRYFWSLNAQGTDSIVESDCPEVDLPTCYQYSPKRGK